MTAGNVAATIDELTGRPLGDHGTANDAIDFLIDGYTTDTLGQEREFLIAWREGSAGDEWPEFYDWLRENAR